MPTAREITLNEDQMLKELGQQQADQTAPCIKYPNTEENFELEWGLIYLLPTFYGLDNEEPHKHLKAFHVTCSTMKLQGVTEE